MRKLIYYTTITLDGNFSGPDGGLEHFEPSEEEHQYANDLLLGADAVVLGRRMYEVMSYWDGVDPKEPQTPRVAAEFAAIYQAKPRFVLSRTLTSVDDKAVLLKDDIIDQVARLKRQDGGYLGLGCGPELLSLFLSHGIVDQMRLLVLPIVLGDGIRLFRDIHELKSLNLLSSQTFGTGSVLLSYASN